MSDELDKARGAMTIARQIAATCDRDETGMFASKPIDIQFSEALRNRRRQRRNRPSRSTRTPLRHPHRPTRRPHQMCDHPLHLPETRRMVLPTPPGVLMFWYDVDYKAKVG
jgi:hypothetical protein